MERFKQLIDDIKSGNKPEASDELWKLAEEVCKQKPDEDINAWAERLASDIVNVDDNSVMHSCIHCNLTHDDCRCTGFASCCSEDCPGD